jgi:hypothetical protein
VKYKRPLITCLDDVTDQYLLNPLDIGAILDIDRTTAADLCARGIISGAFQVGRLWRLEAGRLRAHIEKNRLPRNEHIAALREAARTRRRT